MDFKRPNLVIGLLVIAVLGLATGLLQILKVVDILTNLTDIWIFGIVAPAVGIATDLIIRGIRKPKPDSLKIVEQVDPLPNIQVFTRQEREKSRPLKEFLSQAHNSIGIIGISLVGSDNSSGHFDS